MLHIREAVIVEGKYDKIRLSNFLDATIIETNGFSIFRDREQMSLIRRIAAQRGIVILTDSDSAGFKIRSYLEGCLPKNQVKHVYIPDVYGKERRKSQPSKEGKLGVEGLSDELLRQAFARSGIGTTVCQSASPMLSTADLFDRGLTGRTDSSERRKRLLSELQLPERLSTSKLLQVLNLLLTRE